VRLAAGNPATERRSQGGVGGHTDAGAQEAILTTRESVLGTSVRAAAWCSGGIGFEAAATVKAPLCGRGSGRHRAGEFVGGGGTAEVVSLQQAVAEVVQDFGLFGGFHAFGYRGQT
jgi:hypothetical protein